LQEVDLVPLLQDAHELYEIVAEEQGAELSFEIDGIQSAKICGNRELLSQAVSNLLDNALKYGVRQNGSEGESPHIHLLLRKEADGFVLSVSDNGDGINPEDYERVKERFVRLDKSRSKGGNGLGLSLVSAIAELHGGKLNFEAANPGLRVILDFPAKKSGKHV